MLVKSACSREIVVEFPHAAQLYDVYMYKIVNGATAHAVGPVMCKYVRRELRSLTRDDRERFLDALELVQLDDGGLRASARASARRGSSRASTSGS